MDARRGGVHRNLAWPFAAWRAIAVILPLIVYASLRLSAAEPVKPAGDAPLGIAPPAAMPTGCWEAGRADKLEQTLNAFFAEADTARRAALFKSELEVQQPGLKLEELETIAKGAMPPGEKKGAVWRVQAPWLKDNPRGWFNLALPAAYTPAKAYGVVVALHGSGSDGNNLPSFYSPQLNDAGYFVIYPTTSNANSFWNGPAELAHVYRLIEWLARNYRVDFRKLAITGGSMGGMGTWSHLLARPELWHCGASVAGHPAAMEGEILEKLRGVPFYVLHGEKDTKGASLAPVENVRKAVEELQRRKLNVVYVEEPGAGHTPSMPKWKDMNAWIATQAPKAWSPRPLFLPPPGERPLWQRTADPTGLQDDSAVELLKSGKYVEAKKELDARIAKTPGDGKQYFLRATATLPAMTQPFPDKLEAVAFKDGIHGWGVANENAALRDLDAAVRCKEGKGDEPQGFDGRMKFLIAKIWAKRAIIAIPAGGTGWVTPYQTYAKALQEAIKLDGHNTEAARLALQMNAIMPRGSGK